MIELPHPDGKGFIDWNPCALRTTGLTMLISSIAARHGPPLRTDEGR